MKNNSLTAVVCTYNRYDRLHYCLDSLLNQSNVFFDYNIHVVDNTPKDLRNYNFYRKYNEFQNFSCQYVDTPGLSNARNVGVDCTTSDIISFIDDDAIACPTWANSIMHAFNFTTNTAIVGGKIDPIWENPIPDWLIKDLWGYLSVVNLGDKVKICEKNEWVAGANISFKRAFIGELRFDVNLGRNGKTSSLLSNEESVFVEKLVSSGFDLVYSPICSVEHYVETARITQQWFRKRVIWQAISDFIGKSNNKDLKCCQDTFLKLLWGFPTTQRNISALFKHQKDGLDFKNQLSLLYNFTLAMLSGFETLDI